MEREKINVSFDPDVLATLRDLAARSDRHVAWWVRLFVDRGLYSRRAELDNGAPASDRLDLLRRRAAVLKGEYEGVTAQIAVLAKEAKP